MNRRALVTIPSLAVATLAACSPEPNHACRTSADCRSGRVCSAGICLPPPQDAGPVDGVPDGPSHPEVAIEQRGDSRPDTADVREPRTDGPPQDLEHSDVPDSVVVQPDAPAADSTQEAISDREPIAAMEVPTGPRAIDAYPTDRATDTPIVPSDLADVAGERLDASEDHPQSPSDAHDSSQSFDPSGLGAVGGGGGASSTGGPSPAGGTTGSGGRAGSSSLGGNSSSGGRGGTLQTGGASAGVVASASASATEDAGTIDTGAADADAESHPVVEFPLPTPKSDACGIIKGPDNNLWFGECATERKVVGRITTSGDIREYAAPNMADPRVLAAGPDGNIWFVSNSWSYSDWISLGRLVPDTAEMTPFPVVDNDPNAPVGFVGQISALGAGPDNNLWLLSGGNDTIGKMTTSGVCTLFLPDLEYLPTNSIGRLTVQP